MVGGYKRKGLSPESIRCSFDRAKSIPVLIRYSTGAIFMLMQEFCKILLFGVVDVKSS